jgi:peptide/nickel transport system permease protein
MTVLDSVAESKPKKTRFRKSKSFVVGLILLIFVAVIAVFGPFFAPYSSTGTIGIPGQGPSATNWLGLDFEGRDVLSRLLTGGRTTLIMCIVATILTYAIGLTVGLIAGFSRTIVDSLFMRFADIILSLPALLVMLVLVSGMGNSVKVLVFAAALVLFPGVARIVRTSTLEVSRRAFVEAAVARGESTLWVLRREVLPNILGPVLADLGLRFSWSIILIASVNFLGLGISPPNPDWGLMISENRIIMTSNLYSVLAPAAMIGVLILAVNLVSDSYLRNLGSSGERT